VNAMVPVPFRGDTLWAAKQGDTVMVAIKPICESLTLNWSGQVQRIRRDAILNEGVCITHIPSEGGPQETVCLPLHLLTGWLFGVDDRRIRDPEVRSKILAYKRECYRVLHQHFLGHIDEDDLVDDLPVSADNKVFGVRLAKANAAARLISAVNAIYGPEAARALWERDEHLPRLSHLSVGALAGTASDDPVGCFRHLMRGAAAGRSLGTLMSLAVHDAAAARGLLSYGLRLDPKEAPGFLAIANQHPYLRELFEGTPWAGEWRVALGQLPGARPSRGAIGFSDGTARAVLLSRGEVIGLLNPVKT
jgi:hypothetical protein